MGKHDEPHMQRKERRERKKKRKRKKLFLWLPLLVLLGAGVWFGYIYMKADSVFSDAYEDHGRDKSDLRDEKVDPDIDNVSILIIGVDSNENRRENGDSQLSDTLMLATMNKDDKSVKLVSIPRDTYVYLPEAERKTKINHAHSYGGPTSTINAVEDLMNIPVDYYVKVNFDAFVEVVDTLNGIEVDVPYEFTEFNSEDENDAIHLQPGEQKLNGEEALALARTRKHDSDIERGKRQQEIVKAAMKKATSLSSILKIDNMIEAVGDDNMATDMKFDEMKSFISYGMNSDGLDMETHTLEGYDYQPGSVYYYQLDEGALQETQHMLQDHLELPSATAENSYGKETRHSQQGK